MDLWDSFWSAVAAFIAENGLLAVAFIVLLRSAAVPIPVPADLLVVVVGARAREQQLLLWPAWFVLAISTTAGAALLYAFVRWIGQGEVSHYGQYVGLTTERLSLAETRLVEHGTRAVFVARIVPGLRLAIVAVCGMLRFRWWNFVAAVALGAMIYVAACLTIGYIFGDAIVRLVGSLVFPLGVLEPALGLSILLLWLVRTRRATPHLVARGRLSRASRVRVGALAGALAIAGSTMLVNMLVYVVVPVAANSARGVRGIGSVLTSSGGPGAILLLLLDSVLCGIALGILYAVDDGRLVAQWSDWLRALAFAAVPFLSVMLVLLLAISQSDSSSTAWLALGFVELIRWGAYGVLLGLTYPVLRARRLQALPGGPSTNHMTLTVGSGE
jgi:membrane protein DedA with SNARE-associated domain